MYLQLKQELKWGCESMVKQQTKLYFDLTGAEKLFETCDILNKIGPLHIGHGVIVGLPSLQNILF